MPRAWEKCAGWKRCIPQGNKANISTLNDLATSDPCGSMPSLFCLWSHHWNTALTVQLSNSAPGIRKSLSLRLLEAKRVLSRSTAAACYSLPYYWLWLASRHPCGGSCSLTCSSCFYVLQSSFQQGQYTQSVPPLSKAVVFALPPIATTVCSETPWITDLYHKAPALLSDSQMTVMQVDLSNFWENSCLYIYYK